MRLARMAATPRDEILFSSSALPLITAATPHSRSATRSSRGGNAAGSLPLQLWKSSHRFGVQLEVRTGQRAVSRDVGAQHVCETRAHETLHRTPQRRRRWSAASRAS